MRSGVRVVSPPSLSAATSRATFGDAWSLIRPFWRERTQRRAWLLLIAVVMLTLAGVWLNVRFSVWNNRFYDTLQSRDLHDFWRQLGVFGMLAAAYIVAAVYRQYLQQVLSMQWRTWLTRDLQRRWLQPGTAYRLGLHSGHDIDNPDQRIAEDARALTSSTLDLGLGLLNACVTLVSFVGILWGLSGSLKLPGASGFAVPGYMVFVALAYSMLGSWAASRLGRPLIALSAQQQKVEAGFRYALVQVREHAEAIALARGGAREQARLSDAFNAIRDNWAALIRVTKRLTWFSAGYGQLANVFPFVAAAPRYFSGGLQLGGLMQTAQAFGQVQGSLSWFIDAYSSLADWRATVQRLTVFRDAAADDAARLQTAPRVRIEHAADVLEIDGLQLRTPDDHELARLDLHVEGGDRVLISGPSGSGKSSLLRAIAGLWMRGHGTILLPARASMMFVPQRPYLPDGSLREALAYPLAPDAFETPAMQRALIAAGLQAYAGQLDLRRRWFDALSPGQQQRVQFARVFLHAPDWVFLDEATSALDEAGERELYRALRSACPTSTVVSVGHRATLREFHDVTHVIANAPAWLPRREAISQE